MGARSHLVAVAVAAIGALASGCAPVHPFRAPAAGATAFETTRVAGWRRTYRLHLPPRAPDALLVVLHGGGGDSASMESVSGLSTVGDREGFAVAYADGIGAFGWGQLWNAGHCCGQPKLFGVDDVAFVRTLVFQLSATLHVPTDHVFVVGYSNGALLAYRAASELSAWIGGVAIFAGTMRARGPRDAPTFELAPPVRPLAVLSVHGTRDNRIPYGGTNEDGPSFDVSFQQAGRFWAVGARCTARPVTQYLDSGWERVDVYRGCPPGADVVQITLVDWNHEWPSRAHTSELPAGNPLRGFDMGEVIGAFVAAELRERREARR